MTAASIPTPAALGTSGRIIHWTKTASAAVLGLAAIAVIWPALGASALWIAPVLAFTAGAAGNAIELRRGRSQLLLTWLWAVWTPLAFIVAGLPVWTLNPLNAGRTLSEMSESLALGLRNANTPGDAWMLAGWLVFCGLVWSVAGGQARRTSRLAQASAFFLFAAPFAAPLAFGRTEDAAWQGGAILVGGLLWATRGNLRDGLPALAVVAVAGVVVAAAVAPTERWSGLDRAGGGAAPSGKFNLAHDYGPPQRTDGSTMFDIRAERAALWRGEVLEHFDGHGWSASLTPESPELPQPGAVRTTSTIRIDHLQSDLAFAPGRIDSATGAATIGSARRPGTEAVALTPQPKSGETYTVVSSEVPITPALASVKVPTGPQYAGLTAVFPRSEFGGSSGTTMPQVLAGTPYGEVFALAAKLSAGTTSELEIVENVEAYLTQSGTFRYTKNVGRPGDYPLLDFLLTTHEGYCQHFAGAAGMLLRMAGVPTRVVSGFATGTSTGPGQWKVTDAEGHAWIEVYFPGHGWVAFNPTASGDAAVPPGVATTVKPKPKSPAGTKIPVALVAGLFGFAAALFLVIRLLRGPRRAPEALGDVLVRVVPAPAGPAMTFDELRVDLRQLGPALTALADEAELQRFGPTEMPASAHPRRRVWRALLSDVGLLRTLRIVVLGPGRRPIVDGGGPKTPSSGPPPSVAPPTA